MAIAAYDSRAAQADIESELKPIRELTETPSGLEIALVEGAENLPEGGDKELTDRAKGMGLRYAMRGTRQGASDEKTATDIAAILNQAYQSPLFQEKEQFRGEIFYRKGNGDYALME